MTKKKGALVLLALSLFLVVESIRLNLPGVLFGNGDLESMEAAIFISPNNPDLNFSLGRTYHNLMLGDQSQAVSKFSDSIKLNPLLASSWLELSEIYLDNGERDKSLLALNRSYELAPLSIARLWQGSILALRLGQEDMAFENMKFVAKSDPDLRTSVFDTAWLVANDAQFIEDKVITNEVLISYINYLITTKRPQASLAVWERLEKLNKIRADKQFLDYINFLIDNEKSRHAYMIWSRIIGNHQGDSLMWNGGFESKSLYGGFDWRIVPDNNPGVIMATDSNRSFEGQNSFKIKFNGKHNNDFYHIFQIVPVEPENSYLLTAKVRTEGITTRNGIGIESYCYPDWKLMSKSTKPLTGTNDWKKISVKLDVPKNCNDLIVRIRRFQSDNYDKFISGTAWIDDVKMLNLGNS